MADYPHSEKLFKKWLIEEYFRAGSVDEVLRKHRFEIPISYASYQRVLAEAGIVKAAGSHSKLNEILGFLTRLMQENVPFEYLYKKMPPSFMASAATIYRILSYIKEGITRRLATGLVITPYKDPTRVLIAEDISTPRVELGKPFGALSIPMGFSRKTDPRENAILRVLQQEVFTKQAINKKVPSVIPFRPKPFMYLDIADVRVEIFHLPLPKKFSNTRAFFSYKLKNYRFISINDSEFFEKKQDNFRVGVLEAVTGYKKYLALKRRNLVFNPLQLKSRLNYFLRNEEASPFG
jgi:hypothetical protein